MWQSFCATETFFLFPKFSFCLEMKAQPVLPRRGCFLHSLWEMFTKPLHDWLAGWLNLACFCPFCFKGGGGSPWRKVKGGWPTSRGTHTSPLTHTWDPESLTDRKLFRKLCTCSFGRVLFISTVSWTSFGYNFMIKIHMFKTHLNKRFSLVRNIIKENKFCYCFSPDVSKNQSSSH